MCNKIPDPYTFFILYDEKFISTSVCGSLEFQDSVDLEAVLTKGQEALM